MVTPTKVCSLCQQDLPTTAFYRHPHARLGVGSKCRACSAAYSRVKWRAYYEKHREEILAKCKARAQKRRAAKQKRRRKVLARPEGAL